MLMVGVASPSMAESLDKDFGVIRACTSDIWRLCRDVLPDVGRIKACVQDKMGQLSKGCLDTLLDAMAGSSFMVCKNQTYALCAAARCNVYDGVAYCQCEVKHGDSGLSLAVIAVAYDCATDRCDSHKADVPRSPSLVRS
jgi:hypothetical protein